MGKLLVVFEELENFSSAEWTAISSKLKRSLTSNTENYERKGIDPITAKNVNNLIINSNVEAIRDSEGRRYYICDLNNEKKGNLDYFDSIYKNCMNDETGEAFYNYLLQKVSLENYKDQNFPITKSKLDAMANRLDNVQLYIKDTYVLKKKEILQLPLSALYADYVEYCNNNVNGKSKPVSKIDLNKRFNQLGFKSYKSNGLTKFTISLDELNKIANENKWIHETDEYGFDDSDEYEKKIKETLIQAEEELHLKDTIISNLQSENEKLKKELDQYKKNAYFSK
jgi:hypothetical protein